MKNVFKRKINNKTFVRCIFHYFTVRHLVNVHSLPKITGPSKAQNNAPKLVIVVYRGFFPNKREGFDFLKRKKKKSES